MHQEVQNSCCWKTTLIILNQLCNGLSINAVCFVKKMDHLMNAVLYKFSLTHIRTSGMTLSKLWIPFSNRTPGFPVSAYDLWPHLLSPSVYQMEPTFSAYLSPVFFWKISSTLPLIPSPRTWLVTLYSSVIAFFLICKAGLALKGRNWPVGFCCPAEFCCPAGFGNSGWFCALENMLLLVCAEMYNSHLLKTILGFFLVPQAASTPLGVS